MPHRVSRTPLLTALVLCAVGALFGARDAGAAKPHERDSDAARGRELYERHCLSCHGATAAGDGPVSAALLAEVPNLCGQVDDDDRSEHVDTILEGRGFMPAFALSFDRYDARRVWRELQRRSTAVPAAEPPSEPEEPSDEAAPPTEAPEPDTDQE